MDQDTLLRELWGQLRALRTEVTELRVEISEMEATVADLAARVDDPDRIRLPWPVSLLLLPAALTLALLRQVDELARALSAECDEQRPEGPRVRGEGP
ncbi:hypothetical protein [Nocardia sp. NPDC051750]|uniref:hypothetical protein n=1 Tax=Nocardia sp. NPDC051750 TaxID=3364325 RepID=UPI00378E8059